jgi:phenylacetate-CoA ligase
MGFADQIYRRSPIFVQSLMVAAYGAGWYMRRFGRHYRRKVRELRAHETLSAEAFANVQLDKLNVVIDQARRSAYYGPLLRAAGIMGRVTSLKELSRLSTLSKQTLRSRPRDLLTSKPPWGTKILRSSGTTGTPTDIYYTRRFHQEGLAYFQARSRDWAGIGHRDKRAMFGVRKVCNFEQHHPPFWRSSPAENLVYYSIYHLSPEYLPHYVEHLENWKPRLIMGYPSAINLIARHLMASQQKVPVAAVITTSETVTAEVRSAIEGAFCCRLFDQYGAVEGTHFVSQCEYGRYHVSPERGIIEILDGQSACEPGQEGRVVVTGLENTLQPLIRYEIGDVAYWAADQSCPCGRPMPILGGIQGRYEDYCTTPDGRLMLRFDTVFKGVETILEAQVVQESTDRFTINIVPTADFSLADRAKLIDNFRCHAGNVSVEIVSVTQIPRTSSGKFRAVVNRAVQSVADNELAKPHA